MTGHGTNATPSGQEGYVFPLALWTLAIIAVLLGAAFAAVSAANATFARLQDRDQALSDFQIAETQMLALLLTEPMGLSNLRVGGQLNLDPVSGGFGEGGEAVAAYGAPYVFDAAHGPVIVRLVAVNGLIDLQDEPVRAARALLMAQGHDRAEAEQLAARLGDFIDQDDLRRLGGAEADDYPDGQAPRNAPLSTASEACGALGWAETVSLCADPRLLDLYAFAGAANAMTSRLAPDHLLMRLLDDETAVRRARDALDDRNALVRFSDLGIEGLEGLEENSALPGPSFLIMTHRPDAAFIQVTRIDLTMASYYKPYDVVFTHVIGGQTIEGVFNVELDDTLARLPQAG